MKNFATIAGIYLLFYVPLLGQGSCLDPNLYELLEDNQANCSIDDLRSFLPEVTVKLNFHFIDGVDNSFYPGPPNDANIWNGNNAAKRCIEVFANNYLSNLPSHVNPLQPSILGDSKIRYTIYSDPANTADVHHGIWYHPTTPTIEDLEYGEDVIHVLVFSERPAGMGASADACGIGVGCNSLRIFNWGEALVEDPTQSHAHIPARNLLHEIGHIAGLCHSNSPDQNCSDVNTEIECNGTAPDGGAGSCGGTPDSSSGCDNVGDHTNNIMALSGNAANIQSLTPCQWYTYYTYFLNLGIQQAEIQEDCSVDLTNPGIVTIPTGTHEVYNSLQIITDDIVIEANASLRVTCGLLMAPGRSITVKRAGKLFVDQGFIANFTEDGPWSGIYVEGNNQKEQPAPSLALPNYSDISVAGSVILNGAKIIGANTAIHTHSRDGDWLSAYWGGLVAAYQTDFINNRRAVEFMRYEIFADDFPNTSLLPNKSAFDECRFEEIGDARDNSTGVTIWGCNGIEFRSCQFEGLDNSGIYTINAGFFVRNSSPSSVNQTVFKNVQRAIQVFSTYTNRSYNIDIEQADFIAEGGVVNDINNTTQISIHASNELADAKISECYFSGGRNGVWVDGPSGFGIVNNVFDGVRFPLRMENTGNSFNEVKCNLIDVNGSLIQVRILGENDNLLYRYNDHLRPAQFYSILFSGAANGIIGTIKQDQGSPVDPARNCFGENNKFMAQPNTELTSYHHHPQLSPPYPGCILEPDPAGTYSGSNIEVALSNLDQQFIQPIDCTYEFGAKPKPEAGDEEKYEQLAQYIESFETAVANGHIPSVNEMVEYINMSNEYLATYSGILGGYQRYNDLYNMETFLLENPSKEGNKSLLGAYISHQDWIKANDLLNILPTTTLEDQYYQSTMEINLKAAQQDYSGYNLTANEESLLYQIADSQEPSRAYARALLALYNEESFLPEEDTYGPGGTPMLQGEHLEENSFVRCYPNPTSEVLLVRLSLEELEEVQQGKALNYKIMSIDGQVVHAQGGLQEPQNLIDVYDLPAGMYLLELLLPKGEIETQKIIIQ